MNKEVTKTVGIMLALYAIDYLLVGTIGGLTNFIVPFYGLSLIKNQKFQAVETVLAILFLVNLGMVVYISLI